MIPPLPHSSIYRQRLWKLTLAIIAVAGIAGAMDLASMVETHPAAARMLTAQALVITREGHVAVAFGTAETVVTAADALTRVQAAYAQLLPQGEKPEFTIAGNQGPVYSYVNKDHQTSVIEEVWKKGEAREFNVVYYATGERFFGRFQALIHLQAVPDPAGQVDYRLLVRAAPDHGFWRFLVSRCGVVQVFFRHKTDEVSGLAERIVVRLCKPREAETLRAVGAADAPAATIGADRR